MSVSGLCHICGGIGRRACSICGMATCEKHFASEMTVCIGCYRGKVA